MDAFEALLEIGRSVQADVIDLAGVLELVVRKTSQLLQADLAWVALVEEPAERVQVVESCGAIGENFNRMAVTIGAGLGGVALNEKKTVVVENYAEYTADTPELVHVTMLDEGVVSVMCAPMLRGSTMVGALYAANRRHTRFRPEHVTLLSAVATQVSSAIRHTQMFRELELRNELLEQSFTVHRELTAVGLGEAGVPGIAEALSRVVERALVVEQDVVTPFRQAFGALDEDTPAANICVPIAAGDKNLGQIIVCGGGLSELQLLALDHGATIIALELLKQRTGRDVEWRLRGELLDEMLEAGNDISIPLVERAERLSVDLRVSRRIVALDVSHGTMDYGELLGIVRSKAARRLHGVERSVLAVKRGGRVILALSEMTPCTEQSILDDIREAVALRGASLWAGISRPNFDLSAALREAAACLRLAQTERCKNVIRASDLGPLQFVLASDNVEHAQEMVLEQLGALVAHDAQCKSPLLPTLRAHLQSNGHQPTAASACFIHVSTLKYRLKKISQLLGQDLSDPEVGFQLRLAFKLMDLMDALGVEPSRPPILVSREEPNEQHR